MRSSAFTSIISWWVWSKCSSHACGRLNSLTIAVATRMASGIDFGQASENETLQRPKPSWQDALSRIDLPRRWSWRPFPQSVSWHHHPRSIVSVSQRYPSVFSPFKRRLRRTFRAEKTGFVWQSLTTPSRPGTLRLSSTSNAFWSALASWSHVHAKFYVDLAQEEQWAMCGRPNTSANGLVQFDGRNTENFPKSKNVTFSKVGILTKIATTRWKNYWAPSKNFSLCAFIKKFEPNNSSKSKVIIKMFV
jgi:hypothetical protein